MPQTETEAELSLVPVFYFVIFFLGHCLLVKVSVATLSHSEQWGADHLPEVGLSLISSS